MGFHKRYVSAGKLGEWYRSGGTAAVLSGFGKADSLICEDAFSTMIVGEYRSSKPLSEIITSMTKMLEEHFNVS